MSDAPTCLGWDQGCALLLAGVSIGWLAGLSVSPVTAAVLAALMSVVGGVVAGFAATSSSAGTTVRVNAWPAALLVFGVALGSPAGVIARTHGWLATGIPSANKAASVGGLFTIAEDECLRLQGSPDPSLAGALETSGLAWAPRLARRIQDPVVLRQVVDSLCEP